MTDKEFIILSMPNANTDTFKRLTDLLRPFAKEHNIILTPIDVRPIGLDEFKAFSTALAETVLDKEKAVLEMRKQSGNAEPLPDKEMPPEQKEIRDKAIEMLKKEGKLPS